MRVITWKRPSRVLSKWEIDSFYNCPLHIPTLYKFKTNKMEVPSHDGAFSLKLVMSGEEEYRIGKRTVRLTSGKLLFLNAGETYSSAIKSDTHSLSIFMPEADRRSILKSASCEAGDVLEPSDESDAVSEVSQVAFTPNKSSGARLGTLLGALEAESNEDSLEYTRLLMIEAVNSLFNLAPPYSLLNYVKRSTRDELLQRVMRAKTLIDDSKGQIFDLEFLADTACLSKYYLLRLFREAYGAPPSAYARRLRLREASAAIRKGAPLSRAARRAGYRDLRAFRRARIRYDV